MYLYYNVFDSEKASKFVYIIIDTIKELEYEFKILVPWMI